jgi:hypothetical protein
MPWANLPVSDNSSSAGSAALKLSDLALPRRTALQNTFITIGIVRARGAAKVVVSAKGTLACGRDSGDDPDDGDDGLREFSKRVTRRLSPQVLSEGISSGNYSTKRPPSA